ncbi:MAG: triose-phosphate isomerase, partial [Bryobacteraceae bacterium]
MAANWKMYKTATQTASFFERFIPLMNSAADCEVVIFPPSLCIPAAVSSVRDTSI